MATKGTKNTNCGVCAFCAKTSLFAKSHPVLKKAEPQVCLQDDLRHCEFFKKLPSLSIYG